MSKSTAEIRQLFLDFFESKKHYIVSGSSLIPSNDTTLLFTNAGMNQFKDVFLGINNRPYSRAVTLQRCVRAGGKHNDLKKVGYTSCHHTFFEMLGNFSFGDYFKQEAIQYAWELLTDKKWFSLSKERLWITVYKTDNASYNIWKNIIGIPSKRIIRIGDNKGAPYASDNFWQMGETGPCGPCNEIFYDHGDHLQGDPPGEDNKGNDRYVEIWNIVFMQYNRLSDGTIENLPKPSVDTGMGLERIAAALQNVNSNYEIDLFKKLIKKVSQITYTSDLSNKSLRVIADHIRSCAFLLADGVIPSNENRGHVLRSIIRRAVRHGNILLNVKETFFYKLVSPLIEIMNPISNIIKSQQVMIETILKKEEELFSCTLDRGFSILEKKISNLKNNIMDGKTAFFLYDTYGLPIDIIQDVCREKNIKFDETNFKISMEAQRHRARKSSNFCTNYNAIINIKYSSEFLGYNHLSLHGIIIALFVNGKLVKKIDAEQQAIVFLDRTPFYAESGGQIGDSGEIKNHFFNFFVNDTQKYGCAIGHIGILKFGSMKIGESVKAIVNSDRRSRICINHTATHLMYSAIRKIIGPCIVQRGSFINDSMLRFDFSYFKPIQLKVIHEIENLVNEQIRYNYRIKSNIMRLEDAKKIGAAFLFSKKYSDRVRVLSIGDFSIELCGGTHTFRTGNIGLFRIISESSIASGIRRIEAMTGANAINNLHIQNDQLYNIKKLLKNSTNLDETIKNLINRSQKTEKKLKKLQERTITKESENLYEQIIQIHKVKLIVSELREIDPKILRIITSHLKNKIDSVVIVLATIFEKKVYLISEISNSVSNKIKANEIILLISNIIQGKGGGNEKIAQAIGINTLALPEALFFAKKWIKDKIYLHQY